MIEPGDFSSFVTEPLERATASNEPAERSVTGNTYWGEWSWSSSKGSVTKDEKSPGSIKSSSKVSIKSENEDISKGSIKSEKEVSSSNGSVSLIEDTASSKKTSTIVRIDPKEFLKPGTSVHERGSPSWANPNIPRIDAQSSMQPPSSTPHNTDQDEAEGWTMVVRKKGKQKETREFIDLRRTICNNNRRLANRHWEQMKDYYRKGKLRGMTQEELYQARLHRQRAKREDKKARALTFHEVNMNNGSLLVIDLHGQHVEEGLKYLLDHLAFGSCFGSVRHFWVITGSGKHSVAEARLKEAVLKFMTDEGLTYEE